MLNRSMVAIFFNCRQVEEIAASEAQWKNTPFEARHREMLKRYKHQIKVIK